MTRRLCAIPGTLYLEGLYSSREMGFKQGQSSNKWIVDINKMVPGAIKIATPLQQGF